MATLVEKKTPDRVAYDFDEFAKLFGRDRTWTYRQVKSGKVKAITGYGRMMVAVSEVERITQGEEATP